MVEIGRAKGMDIIVDVQVSTMSNGTVRAVAIVVPSTAADPASQKREVFVLKVKQTFRGEEQSLRSTMLRRRVGELALSEVVNRLTRAGDLQAASNRSGTTRRAVLGVHTNMCLPKSFNESKFPAAKLVCDAKRSPGAKANLNVLKSMFETLDADQMAVMAPRPNTDKRNHDARPAMQWMELQNQDGPAWNEIYPSHRKLNCQMGRTAKRSAGLHTQTVKTLRRPKPN